MSNKSKSEELKERGRKEDELLKDWNPQEQSSSSYLNMLCLNPNDPGSILFGRNSSTDTLCKFYDGFSSSC